MKKNVKQTLYCSIPFCLNLYHFVQGPTDFIRWEQNFLFTSWKSDLQCVCYNSLFPEKGNIEFIKKLTRALSTIDCPLNSSQAVFRCASIFGTMKGNYCKNRSTESYSGQSEMKIFDYFAEYQIESRFKTISHYTSPRHEIWGLTSSSSSMQVCSKPILF